MARDDLKLKLDELDNLKAHLRGYDGARLAKLKDKPAADAEDQPDDVPGQDGEEEQEGTGEPCPECGGEMVEECPACGHVEAAEDEQERGDDSDGDRLAAVAAAKG